MRMSSLIRDPVVRAAFERAERDYGQTFAIPDDPPRHLDGGAAEAIERPLPKSGYGGLATISHKVAGLSE